MKKKEYLNGINASKDKIGILRMNKNEFCLDIASKAKEFIADEEAKALIETAIRISRDVMKDKSEIAEKLYDYINHFTIYQENATDENTMATWNSIIDAIAIICKNVYLETGAEYFPEPIELVGDDTVDHMLNSFLSVSENDLEISIRGEKMLRLWTAAGCIVMNEVHHIQKYLPNAWAIGDDEGGFAIVRVKNYTNPGLYAVSFSDLDDSDKKFLAPSLSEFLFDGVGADVFLDL